MSLLYDFRICSEIKVNCSSDIRAIPRSGGGRDGAGGGGDAIFIKYRFTASKLVITSPTPSPVPRDRLFESITRLDLPPGLPP